jgi:MarR family transcriptional regulator, organic hydroperoxide resistance regulator
MPEPIDDNLAETLLGFARALRARQAVLLAAHGLHPGQDALLVRLWQQPGLRQVDLAEQLGVEAPTITRMVHRLERGGLVERRRDPDDGRTLRIHPTPRARLLEVMVRRTWSDLDEQLIAALGPGDAERFRRLAQEATVALESTPP